MKNSELKSVKIREIKFLCVELRKEVSLFRMENDKLKMVHNINGRARLEDSNLMEKYKDK